MKFLTSSSSTASSTITSTTTSTSFGSNVHNSRSTTPAGCIAGVFRRLLCLKSLPTHPSDHFKDTDHDSVSVELDGLPCASAVNAEERVESSSTPSIVARLMGLESLPQTEKSPSSIARSRSMNSVDLMKELVSIQGRHRRAKSFRETAPTFIELEDEDFFVLSFENVVDESRKSETGSKQTKQSGRGAKNKSQNSAGRRESVYEKNKENQDPTNVLNNQKQERTTDPRKASQRAISDGELKVTSDSIRPLSIISSSQTSFAGKEVESMAKPTNRKPENESGRRRRMKKRKDDSLPAKKVESDCSDSENSSPNSVLDIMKFPSDPEVTSAEGLSRLSNSKSRRTLAEELENYRKLNHQCVDKSLISSNAPAKSRTCSGGKCVELRKNDRGRQNNYVDMWGETCKLAERDVIRSNWTPRSKEIQTFEGHREINGEFEIQIFEELLGELVDQLLVGTCHQNV